MRQILLSDPVTGGVMACKLFDPSRRSEEAQSDLEQGFARLWNWKFDAQEDNMLAVR